jgi:hypothetical protein
MQDQDPRAGEDNRDANLERVTTTRLKSSGEVMVEHHEAPPPGPPDKQIHARRPLPIVPDRPAKPAEDVEGKPDSSD